MLKKIDYISKDYDRYLHLTGKSEFVDDMNIPSDTMYASVFYSSVAKGKIKNIDFKGADKLHNVFIFTAKDIPGENQIGGIIKDELLFAEDEVDFVGEPIGVLVAETREKAEEYSKKIEVEYEQLEPIITARESFLKNNFIMPPRIFESGDIVKGFKKCEYIFEDKVEFGGQEHLYLETQGAIALPLEGNNLKIISSTQNPTAVQRITASILGISNNNIEVDVLRLGGAFGGKEDQANAWAVIAGLAAYKLKKPVKLILERSDDIKLTGKRHPYSIDYRIGFAKDYKIIAYEVIFYQNAGAAADLSPAVLDRTLFHCNGSYFIPNLKATGYSCKTNLPPNTAFRGFGAPQGIFAIESAIFKSARKLRISPQKIQEINLLTEGKVFHYGQVAKNCTVKNCYDSITRKINISKKEKEISLFNTGNTEFRKGFYIMPLTFGISFTNTMMNQASALVNIYSDGSVSISTAAIEMGQGVNYKIRQVASEELGIDISKIRVETTNTSRIANTSPTAASSGADLNGNASRIACREILNRITKYYSDKQKSNKKLRVEFKKEQLFINGKKQEQHWKSVVTELLMNRISLSAHCSYATPKIKFDKIKNKGNPFSYHTYGAAYFEVTADISLGTFKLDEIVIIHDGGKVINKVIDTGQIEGALAQGIGMMTMEEIIYDEKGNLTTNSLSKYKVPDIYSMPDDINITFYQNNDFESGLKGSKAVGEPPLVYGIGAYFAIINAIGFNKEINYIFESPLTNERIFNYINREA